MKRTSRKLWIFSVCFVVTCFIVWIVPTYLNPKPTFKGNDSEILLNSVTPSPKTTANSLLDAKGNVIRDWKTENPEAAKGDWLNEGVWLKGAESSPLSFSPDGRWIVGGKVGGTGAMLWDTRTGENKGVLGESFRPNKYIDFGKVSFLSNQKIALLRRHEVTIFDLNLLPVSLPPRRPTYLSMGYCGPISKRGVWTYTYDIYDRNSVTNPSQVNERLRFWDFKNAKFTRVLPASLVNPVFFQNSEYAAPVTIKNHGPWLAVSKDCGEIFVLNRDYEKVWQENLQCPQFPMNSGSKKLSLISDFELGDKNILYLLDQNRGLRQVDLKTGKENKAWSLPDSASFFALSDNDKLWAFGNKEGRLILVDATTRKIICNIVLPFSTEFLTFSPDSSSIAVGGLVVLPVFKPVQKN